MLPALVVPAFGGKGSSILHFGLHVRLWRQVAHLEPSWEDSALIPRMGGVARQACVSATSEHTLNNDGADRISTILHEHFAPDAVESVYPAVVRLLQFEGSGQTMDVFFEFDVPCRNAESEMQAGGGFRGSFVSVLCMQTASLSKSDKSLGLASIQGNTNISAAPQQTFWTVRWCRSSRRLG